MYASMNIYLEKFDASVIHLFRKYSDEFARIAFFIVFFWFGILKVFLISPAGPLVSELLSSTFLQFIPENTFMILFGLFEVAIGILALIPKMERITFLVMGLHLITTALPLFILPDTAWYALFVPTLIGQYIIKNLVLLAVGMVLFAHIKPMTETHHILAEEDDDINLDL
jgi:uncharacterized membrane protein YkgB